MPPLEGPLLVTAVSIAALLWAASVVVCVLLAPRKDRAKTPWAVAAIFFGPVAVILLVLAPDRNRERAHWKEQVLREAREIRREREWREMLAQTPRPPADVTLPEPWEDEKVPPEWQERYAALRGCYLEQRRWVLKGSPTVARSSGAQVVHAVAEFLQLAPPEPLRGHVEEIGRQIQRLLVAQIPPDHWTPHPPS